MGRGGDIGRDFGARMASAVLLLAMTFMLAACSAGSILLDSSAPSSEPKGKPVPPVAIAQVAGIPPDRLASLVAALAASGASHDIGFVQGEAVAGAFSFAGTMKAQSESAGIRVSYEWQLRDADGVIVGTISGEENAGVYTGADPWAGVSAAILDRIARRTAEQVAQKLSALGYSTRLAGLISPPSAYFAKAGAGAEREIDFETVHGPGLAALGTIPLQGADIVVEHEDIAPTVAFVNPIPGEGTLPTVEIADKGFAPTPPAPDGADGAETTASIAADASPVPVRAEPGQKAIRAVAVVPVQGSPGGGDGELTAAMRKVLSGAGWPVVSKPQADALTLEGHVKLADKGADQQTVSIRWLVRAPGGEMLGDVKQANDVPRGSLDAGWGGAAQAVAEAAAAGIFDVVKRYR
jgi:hypothetical protein